MTVAVNGVTISEDAIHAEMQYHPEPNVDAARTAAARALVVRRLLLEEAHRNGLSGDGDELIATVIEREVTVADPDEATCQRYFQANRARFRSPDLFEAQHILIAAAPDDDDGRAAARVKARELIARIERDPTAFGPLAREHSDCPSKTADGHLGQLTRGSTVPEFETYLFSLEDGEICAEPVESRYGVHVVRLLKRIEGRDLPFEAAHARVAEFLRDRAWRTALRQYIAVLAGRAEIEGIEIERASSPLVQ
jgi:peptidyl-prolyl cis-trans isomerase C